MKTKTSSYQEYLESCTYDELEREFQREKESNILTEKGKLVVLAIHCRQFEKEKEINEIFKKG